EELRQKKKIDLGPNWLRKVFISRDKEEYRNWHIEYIGLALKRMNLSKNKAQNIAVTFLDKWLTFFKEKYGKNAA
ncbi:28169_t:CDS:1, partial [Gigaspora margarita]